MFKSIRARYHSFVVSGAKLLGFADGEKRLFGITNKESHSMVMRFLHIHSLKTFVGCVLVTCLTLISPFGSMLFKRYIMTHPNVILESLQEMDKKEREKSQVEAQAAATEVAQSIQSDESAPFLGNANASKVMIEFYDYACSYCKKSAAEIKNILAKRSDVKVILQDYPVLSMASLVAAKASLFVAKNYPEKLRDFHFKLMDCPNVTEEEIKKLGSTLGLPAKQLAQAMTSSEFESKLRENYNRGSRIRATGTPVFIINGKLYVGHLTAQQITDALDKQ